MPESIHLATVGHKAPIPLGARVGPLLCSSGIAGKSPLDGSLPPDGATQVAHAFTNMKALLAAGGAVLADVCKLTVTLNDDSLRDAINTAWLAAWPDANARPARHIHIQALGHGMLVQLEVLAFIAERRA